MGLGFVIGGFLGGLFVYIVGMKSFFFLYVLVSFGIFLVFVVMNKYVK